MTQPPPDGAPEEDVTERPDDGEPQTASAVLRDLIEEHSTEAALEAAMALHPAELADALEGLGDEHRAQLLTDLDNTVIGDALLYVEPHFRGELLSAEDPHLIAEAIGPLPDDIATDVVQDLDRDVADAVLADLPAERRSAIERLLTYGEETAGGRMTGQLVTISPTLTVGETMRAIRQAGPDSTQPFYIYVTDAARQLLGVLNLRMLIATDDGVPVGEIMQTGLVTVAASADQEEAARLLKQYRLLALPVIDDDGRLLGAITSDDLIDVLEDEATEDMYRIVGVNEEEDLRGVWSSVRYRLPWLTVNLGTALAAAWVVSLFESTLEQVAVLAAYLPVVAGMGGNAGIQTLTVVVRSLALGRLSIGDALTVIRHELEAGFVTGTFTGVVVGAVSFFWQGSPVLGAVIGAALMVNVLIGAFFGVVIPMGLHRLRQDPALSGGIWLTTTTDVLGFLVYLGTAALLLDYF